MPPDRARQPHGEERHQRTAEADAEVSEAHGAAAGCGEPARQQDLVRERAAADVAERVEEIEEIEAGERVDHAEPDERDARHENSGHHQTAWAEAVHRPPGQKTEQRSHQELAERVPGGHLGARPAEVAHHEVVKERQAVEREPDDREQRQERRRGDLRLRTPNAHLKHGPRT